MVRTSSSFRIPLLLVAIAILTGALIWTARTPLRAQAPIVGQPGIVAAYGFEEAAGTTIGDATGNGHIGTAAGTAWSSTGRFGNALSFNGINSRVNIPDDSGLQLTNGMTIEAWVNPATLSGWRSVVMKESPTGLAYALYAHDGTRPAGYLNTGLATDFGVNGTTTLQVNTWTHLATTYDGSAMKLYINGVLVGTRATSGTILTTTNPLRIGGNAPWGEYFSGLIDEVRIYNRALTPAEIQTDMAAPVSQVDFTPPTVSSTSPSLGATNVNLSANVAVTFNEAMDANTINASSFELRNDTNQIIPATVTYSPATFTAVLDPAAALISGVTYTAIVHGGTDVPAVRDAAGNALAATAVWTFTTSPPDTTPPTIVSVVPAAGATGVSVTANISATFSEAMDASTIHVESMVLRDPAGQVVPASVIYTSASPRATLNPSGDLVPGATYTVTVVGGAGGVKDASGNPLAATASWSFVTAAAGPIACPCSLWPSSTLPGTADFDDPSNLELGVKFRADRNGYITAVRFYKGARNTGVHIGSLWSESGTRLAAVTFIGETASGWQEAELSPAVQVTANAVYIASYHAPHGHYAADPQYFNEAVDRPPLRAFDNVTNPNGVYRYDTASAFPDNSFNGTNYWIDVVFVETLTPDTTGPAVLVKVPAANATNVPHASAVTALFNETIDQATLDSSSFQLLDAANQVVPASVTYDALSRTAKLRPSVPLNPSAVYTAILHGGAAGARVKDLSGNAIPADITWTFTTAGVPVDDGPGGPVLVIGSTFNPFGRYLGEILRNEGLNVFTVTDITLVTPASLASRDVVILGEMPLTADQVSMFTQWVTAGGKLIAMRPDKQLASLMGLSDAGATAANQYLLIGQSGPGAGLVNQTIQYHGTADLYTLADASSLATLFSDAATATPSPAVTLRNVGASGGQAAAFTYDLARSVVYTRQGNPAWSGQERDGFAPIRSDDLFWGAAFGDPQPNWIDMNKVAIPQADEQQRLLANLVLQMSSNRTPLPRLWYLPRGLKAAVVMTGDDHANGGTAGRFELYKLASPKNCSVIDWQCIRSTSYVYPGSPITDAQATGYIAEGFEVALHPTTDCQDFTTESLNETFTTQLSQFTASYPSVPAPSTGRTHCIVWSDFMSHPKVELSHGIRFDTNYYYWPYDLVLDRPGLFTGSGMPMRYADTDGTIVDVYQAVTQMPDESFETFPYHIDTLLDRALGAEGYYGVFTTNMHTDAASHAGSDAIVASAKARGVPVVSSKQMLTWLDGRNASSFGTLGWTGGSLTFNLTQAAGANGLEVMLPAQTSPGILVSLMRGTTVVPFVNKTVKGMSYATFSGASGAYTAVYSGAPDTAIVTPPPTSTTSTSVTFRFTATPAAGATFQCSLDGAAFVACVSPRTYTGLLLGSHTFQVQGVNLAGTDATPASFTFTVVPPDTTITASPTLTTATASASFSFIATPSAGATFECSLDASAFAACTSPRSYTTIAVGTHTFQVRAVGQAGADATPASFTWTRTTLVAAFGFEEETGATTEDSSGLGNTGTLLNAVRAPVGRFGHALSFNGTNAWVTVPDSNALDLTSAMTIEAWVNPSSLTNWRTILMKEASSGLSYSLYASNGTRPATFLRVGSSDVGRTGTAALPLNTWTHVAATYDATTLKLYVNGVLVSSGAIAGNMILPSNNPLRIGGNLAWGEYFAGMIDEVRVYSRVLTAAEIGSDMNTPIK